MTDVKVHTHNNRRYHHTGSIPAVSIIGSLRGIFNSSHAPDPEKYHVNVVTELGGLVWTFRNIDHRFANNEIFPRIKGTTSSAGREVAVETSLYLGDVISISDKDGNVWDGHVYVLAVVDNKAVALKLTSDWAVLSMKD